MRILSSILIFALTVFNLSARDDKMHGVVGQRGVGKPKENVDADKGKSAHKTDNYWVSKGSGFWGVQFGADVYCADIYNLGGSKLFDNLGWGGFAGISYKYQWRNGAVLESGVQFAYDFAPVGVKYTDSATGSTVRSVLDLARGVIHMPLRVGYRFNFWDNYGFSITGGLRGSCGLYGNFEQEGVISKEYPLYGSEGVWHRLGLSASLALTLELDGPVSLSLLANTAILNMSTRDIYDRPDMHDISLSLGFTYFFNRRREK